MEFKDLYESNDCDAIQNDLAIVGNLTDKFQKYSINLDISNIKDAIIEYEEITRISKKLSVYAFLYSVTQLNNCEATSFTQSVYEKLLSITCRTAFFQNKISSLPQNTLLAYIGHDDYLIDYKLWFNNIFQDKKHLLTVEAEEVLVRKSITSRESWIRLYNETLSRINIVYKNTTKNIAQMIDIANHNIHSKEREHATVAVNDALEENIFYITHVYNNVILDVATEQELRNRQMPESFRHVLNGISQESVNRLVDTVVSNYSKISHRYYKIKAALLGKDKLEYWDRNAAINKTDILKKNIQYKEACDIVIEVFDQFSPIFSKVAKNFIDNKWIDVYPSIGKESGAFSCSCTQETHPYIMLNYSGSFRDVCTLAHELGHGVHQLLSAKNGVLLSDTPITIAETASLFAEKMLFEHMFQRAKTTDEKIDLLCSRIDDMINSNMRQIAFFQFERICHDKRKARELSIDDINSTWLSIQRGVCGDYVNIDERICYLWSAVSHFFHSPFYVYAYSFGELFVNALYAQYQKDGRAFMQEYIDVLTRGGIDNYETIANRFGLNVNSQQFWQSGLDDLISQINLLEIYM